MFPSLKERLIWSPPQHHIPSDTLEAGVVRSLLVALRNTSEMINGVVSLACGAGKTRQAQSGYLPSSSAIFLDISQLSSKSQTHRISLVHFSLYHLCSLHSGHKAEHKRGKLAIGPLVQFLFKHWKEICEDIYL